MQELSWTFTWAQRPSEVVVERAPALAKGKRGKWCAAQTQESEWFASGVERFDKFKGCLAVVCSWGAPLRSTASSQRPCRIPRVASVAKPLLRSATSAPRPLRRLQGLQPKLRALPGPIRSRIFSSDALVSEGGARHFLNLRSNGIRRVPPPRFACGSWTMEVHL